MKENYLVLEIMSGPLDGHRVELAERTVWACRGEGPLIFPWDRELGTPQARFFVEGGQWRLEAFPSPHGTYRVNSGERIEKTTELHERDFLKASKTWLMVRQIGSSS